VAGVPRAAKKGGGQGRQAGEGAAKPSPPTAPERRPPSSQKQDLRKLERAHHPHAVGDPVLVAGAVQASNLKRALLRKDPTFSEQDYGFRGFRELLRHLEDRQGHHLTDGSAPGDPEVDFPSAPRDEDAAFQLLRDTVKELMDELGGDPPLSGSRTSCASGSPTSPRRTSATPASSSSARRRSPRTSSRWTGRRRTTQEYYLYVEERSGSRWSSPTSTAGR
jgi:hypothetical protein